MKYADVVTETAKVLQQRTALREHHQAHMLATVALLELECSQEIKDLLVLRGVDKAITMLRETPPWQDLNDSGNWPSPSGHNGEQN